MDFVDPTRYVITRKRKKYRFALFANSPLCFELEEWIRREANVMEIGAGTGLFSVELASHHPDKVFVAIDVKGDRLQKGAREAEARGLRNIFFVRARADQLEEMFARNSLDQIWITFPDPFPKKRSAGRRLTHPTYLKQYRDLLGADGELYLKHDDREFFCWSLEQLVKEHWQIKQLSFDVHESTIDGDATIMTTYEQRWTNEGRVINYVQASCG